MLKIIRKSTSAAHAVYALAGEVTSDQLPRLDALVSACRAAGRDLTLNLEWVWRVDSDAMAFFSSSGPGRAVRLVGLPEGLEAWLHDRVREDE